MSRSTFAAIVCAVSVTCVILLLQAPTRVAGPISDPPGNALGLSPRRTVSERDQTDGNSATAAERRIIWRIESLIPGKLVPSPDESYLACVLYPRVFRSAEDHGWKRVCVIDLKSGESILDTKVLQPLAVAFLTDGPRLAILSRDIFARTTKISVLHFDSRAPLEIDCACNCDSSLDCFFGVSQTAQAVALWDVDRSRVDKFSAWSAETGKPVTFATGGWKWSGGGISPDGELLAHGGWPGPGIRISRAQLDEQGARHSVSFCMRDDLDRHDRHDWVTAASFSEDSRRFLTVYDDGNLFDWTIISGEEARPALIGAEGEFANCTSLTPSHSGGRLFYALNDGTVRVASLHRQ